MTPKREAIKSNLPSGRPCLHCGKLFAVAKDETPRQRDNFCSAGCSSRFRSLFDTCFVQGCHRRHQAKGFCAVHSRALLPGSGLRGRAALRLSPLLNYGLARRETFVKDASYENPWQPVAPSRVSQVRSVGWRRIVERYQLLGWLFGAGPLTEDGGSFEPLSAVNNPEIEVDQARFTRSTLM